MPYRCIVLDQEDSSGASVWGAAGCFHGSGFGRAVGCREKHRDRGSTLWTALHAQRSAVGFYARAGFTPRGEPFDEAGIAHQEMVRAL